MAGSGRGVAGSGCGEPRKTGETRAKPSGNPAEKVHDTGRNRDKKPPRPRLTGVARGHPGDIPGHRATRLGGGRQYPGADSQTESPRNGGTEVAPCFIGGVRPSHPQTNHGGRGRVTPRSPYPHPHGAQIAFGFGRQKGLNFFFALPCHFFGYIMGSPNAGGGLPSSGPQQQPCPYPPGKPGDNYIVGNPRQLRVPPCMLMR